MCTTNYMYTTTDKEQDGANDFYIECIQPFFYMQNNNKKHI